MTWLPVGQHLTRHRKLQDLAHRRGWNDRYAAGLLLDLWSWAVDNCPDGYLERTSPAAPAKALHLPPAAFAELVRDMREVGFIDAAGPTAGRLHEWDDWGGRVLHAREQNAERQRRSRERRAGNDPESRVTAGASGSARPADTSARTDATLTRDGTRDRNGASRVTSQSQRRVEERREEPPSPIRTDADAWDETIEALTEPWRSAVRALEGTLSRSSIVAFFRGTELECADDHVDVVFPNAFARNWADERYREQVRTAIESTGGSATGVRFVTRDKPPAVEMVEANGSAEHDEPIGSGVLRKML